MPPCRNVVVRNRHGSIHPMDGAKMNWLVKPGTSICAA